MKKVLFILVTFFFSVQGMETNDFYKLYDKLIRCKKNDLDDIQKLREYKRRLSGLVKSFHGSSGRKETDAATAYRLMAILNKGIFFHPQNVSKYALFPVKAMDECFLNYFQELLRCLKNSCWRDVRVSCINCYNGEDVLVSEISKLDDCKDVYQKFHEECLRFDELCLKGSKLVREIELRAEVFFEAMPTILEEGDSFLERYKDFFDLSEFTKTWEEFLVDFSKFKETLPGSFSLVIEAFDNHQKKSLDDLCQEMKDGTLGLFDDYSIQLLGEDDGFVYRKVDLPEGIFDRDSDGFFYCSFLISLSINFGCSVCGAVYLGPYGVFAFFIPSVLRSASFLASIFSTSYKREMLKDFVQKSIPNNLKCKIVINTNGQDLGGIPEKAFLPCRIEEAVCIDLSEGCGRGKTQKGGGFVVKAVGFAKKMVSFLLCLNFRDFKYVERKKCR